MATPIVHIQPPKGVAKPSVLDLPHKKEITILLIGETGAGKTAFMSLLANLFHGRGPEELEERNDKKSEAGGAKNQSQTKEATLYILNTSNGTTIRILDTPGLADTKGLAEDEVHKERINNAIKNNVKYIDAVCILANGTVERLGMATEYTLNQITKMFPYSIVDNIGFVFTHCDEITRHVRLNDLPDSLKALRTSKDWVLQNPLAYLQGFKELQARPSTTPAQVRKGRKNLVECYDDAVESLNGWVTWLDSRDVQPTHEILKLYQMSTDIEAQMNATWQRIAQLSTQREEAKQLERDLNSAEMSIKDVKKRVQDQTAPAWETVATTRHNTICIVSNCNSNCHVPCALPFSLDLDYLGDHCSAFGGTMSGNGKTTKCIDCDHTAEHHRHHNYTHQKLPRPVPDETKEALQKATTKEQAAAAALTFAKRRIEESDKDIQTAQATIRDLIEGYNKLALSKDFVGHIRAAIKMLQAHKSNLETQGAAEKDIKLIDENIEEFQRKLDVLQVEREAELKAAGQK